MTGLISVLKPDQARPNINVDVNLAALNAGKHAYCESTWQRRWQKLKTDWKQRPRQTGLRLAVRRTQFLGVRTRPHVGSIGFRRDWRRVCRNRFHDGSRP